MCVHYIGAYARRWRSCVGGRKLVYTAANKIVLQCPHSQQIFARGAALRNSMRAGAALVVLALACVEAFIAGPAIAPLRSTSSRQQSVTAVALHGTSGNSASLSRHPQAVVLHAAASSDDEAASPQYITSLATLMLCVWMWALQVRSASCVMCSSIAIRRGSSASSCH